MLPGKLESGVVSHCLRVELDTVGRRVKRLCLGLVLDVVVIVVIGITDFFPFSSPVEKGVEEEEDGGDKEVGNGGITVKVSFSSERERARNSLLHPWGNSF